MLDEAEYGRWIRSSKGACSARGDFERKEYNWACFKAHQAAEFSVKALLHGLGLPAYGHSVSALLSKAPSELKVEEKLIHVAKTLDKYYVPTRYPNAWAEGVPEDYYTVEDANQAIEYAKKILGWVEASWKLLKKGKG